MAEVVTLLVQHLKTLIGEGNKLFADLSDDMNFVKQELERMLAFLSQADAQEDNDSELAVQVDQVRDIVYDTEDVVDECNFRFSSQPGGGYLWQVFAVVKSLRARYRLAPELKRIRTRVQQISDGHKRYIDRLQVKTETFADSTEVDWQRAAILQDDADLVGMDQPKDDLKTKVLGGDSQRKVISVVGMPGSGKTTLVKKVYEEVKSQFGFHAWVAVSRPLDIKELLKNLVGQLFLQIRQKVPEQVLSKTVDELREFIKAWLKGTSTIIVFDDIQKAGTWDELKVVLPKIDSKCRVLLTTRYKDVAVDDSYEMKVLSQDDSRTLFFKKVFKDGKCPERLKEVSEKILSKCGGLPYAVLSIARIFASKSQKLEDWNTTYDSIPHELGVDGILDSMRRYLLVSFYQLPHRLKFCLLYLSIFPNYNKMKWMHVVRLWIAEGLLEENETLATEDVGSHDLQALVNKNLLQVVEQTPDGRPKACAVQGILHEIIVSKSKKGKMVTIARQKGFQVKWPEKVRRLAIHGPLENTMDVNRFKQLRSLILFSPKDLPRDQLLSKMLCDGSRLLKVLDLRGAALEAIPKEVFKLYLLEYLSLRSTKVKTVPKAIGKLRNLETLDLKKTFVIELPVEILRLQRLRHLIIYNYKDVRAHAGVQSFSAPYKIGSLVSLQKLSYLDADERKGVKIVTEIGKLTGLRRLGITKLRKEDGKDLCSSLESLTNLRSLFLVSREAKEIIDVQSLQSAPPLLRTLTLRGRLEKMPQWISSLQDLTKVGLLESGMVGEPLQYLEDLPNLVELCLFRFYEGEELHFKAEKFPNLKKLILASLSKLRTIQVEESSMPYLEQLILVNSKHIEKLPSGIEYLGKLQYVQLVNMAQRFVTSLADERRRTRARIYTGTWEDIAVVRKLQNIKFLEVAKIIDPSLEVKKA